MLNWFAKLGKWSIRLLKSEGRASVLMGNRGLATIVGAKSLRASTADSQHEADIF